MQTVAHESSLGRLTLRTAKPDDDSRVPMFRSMEAALLFAYTWRARPGVKIGQIGEFTGKDGAAMLSIHERKAQAQFILDVIESHLSHDQRALLDATHGGERGERHAGVERLVCLLEHVNRNRALVRMIVARDFVYGEGYSPSLSRIARDCGVSATTACRVAAQITPELAELRKATHAKLRPAFERRGWIAREVEQIQ
jgi:hypothetical protein